MLRFISAIAMVLATVAAVAQPTFTPLKNLTRDGKLPERVVRQHSNNNLDLAYYKGRYYWAFRTAPTHFASKKTVLYVVSSADRETWEYETEFNYQKDIREPRFVVYKDSLMMYFFIGGDKKFKFEPQEIRVTKTTGNKGWTNAYNVGLDGYVPWRLRVRNDSIYLSAYYGKNLYNKKHKSDLRIFKSADGNHWNTLTDSPQINIAHAEEGEFIFDKQGCMYATVRLESNGALVCKGDNCQPQVWQYKRTKDKYDSALLFEHGNDIYLIARRNPSGPMDRVKHRRNEDQGRMRNLIRYSFTKKKTALYKLNKETLTMETVLDFPSTGDNAYAAIAQIDEHSFVVMNYSCDIDKREKIWISGQLGKTYIYETVLKFDK
jgi:hypothetical protein